MLAPRDVRSGCSGAAVGARHLHTYERLGVTLMATMGVPRVPRLSGDALPYHLHAGRVRDGQWELQDRECAHHVDMINRIMSTGSPPGCEKLHVWGLRVDQKIVFESTKYCY